MALQYNANSVFDFGKWHLEKNPDSLKFSNSASGMHFLEKETMSKMQLLKGKFKGKQLKMRYSHF